MIVKEDPHVKLADLQKKIQYLLNIDPANIVFEYQKISNGYELVVSTINPLHRQSFLFNKIRDKTKIGAIQKMFEYARNYKSTENSYTLQWTLVGKNKLQTSYVSAPSIVKAIEKITYGKDSNSIIIFSASLNSIA